MSVRPFPLVEVPSVRRHVDRRGRPCAALQQRRRARQLRGQGGEAVIAALFVQTRGIYFGLPDVDPWDMHRDARLYVGPWPVVAHPPCERWGRYWNGGPSARVPRMKGDDAGCFQAALNAVRTWGGVLEHPEASAAWKAFNLNPPPKWGGCTWLTSTAAGHVAWNKAPTVTPRAKQRGSMPTAWNCARCTGAARLVTSCGWTKVSIPRRSEPGQ
jgi:hypothetical protein